MRQQVVLHDMHDPLARISRQVDLLVPREVLQRPLDVGILEEAERQFDADHAAFCGAAVEYGDLIAAAVDVGVFLWLTSTKIRLRGSMPVRSAIRRTSEGARSPSARKGRGDMISALR